MGSPDPVITMARLTHDPYGSWASVARDREREYVITEHGRMLACIKIAGSTREATEIVQQLVAEGKCRVSDEAVPAQLDLDQVGAQVHDLIASVRAERSYIVINDNRGPLMVVVPFKPGIEAMAASILLAQGGFVTEGVPGISVDQLMAEANQ